MIPKTHIQIGKFSFYLWSGSWCWYDHIVCEHCNNIYIGPFGFEWEKEEPE